MVRDKTRNDGGDKGLRWVAAEPPSDGLRWATWSTEILSASTVFETRKNNSVTPVGDRWNMIKKRRRASRTSIV